MRQNLEDWLTGGSGTEVAGLLLAPVDERPERPRSAEGVPLLTAVPERGPAPTGDGAESTSPLASGPASGGEPRPHLPVGESGEDGDAPKPEETPAGDDFPMDDSAPMEDIVGAEAPADDEPVPLDEENGDNGDNNEEGEDEGGIEQDAAESGEVEVEAQSEPAEPELPQEPRSMPALWTHAVSMPDDWSSGALEGLMEGGLSAPDEEMEESEGTRNKSFTRKLHQGLQARKTHAMGRRPRESKITRYWPRALAFCLVLLLALTGAYIVLRYLQGRAPHPMNGESPELACPVKAEAGPEEKPERENVPAPAAVVLPSGPVETPPSPVIQPTEEKSVSGERVVSVPTAPVSSTATSPSSNEAPARPVVPVLPVSHEEQIRRGTTALNEGRYDEALERFSWVLERGKRDLRAWMGLVAAFEGKGAVGEAFRVLVDARNTLPRDPTIETKLRELQPRVR